MIKTFTQDDVIRYVYEETTDEENQIIEETLVEDPDLLMFYLDIVDLKEGLDRVEKQPSERAVQHILAYSRSFSVNQSRPLTV